MSSENLWVTEPRLHSIAGERVDMPDLISPRRIVWLYEKDHRKQPFINLGLETLVESGCDVTFINMTHETTKDKGYRHVGLYNRSRHRWINSRIAKQYGAYQAGVLLPAVMYKGALRFKPDIVIATLPMGLIAGSWLKRQFGCRLVYYPLELYGEQLSPFSRFLKWYERALLSRRIDCLITQNEPRAEVYRRERGARVEPTIIPNFKRRKRMPSPHTLRQSLELPADRRIVLYEGMITPGRWLDRLIESASLLPEWAHLVLLGKVDQRDNWWKKTVEGLTAKTDIGSKMTVLPWVAPERLADYISDADAGVIIYDDSTRNNLFCAPGKLSDYVLARVPVVAPDFPGIGPMIREWRIGATFHTAEPREIADAIRRVISIPKEQWKNSLDRAAEVMVWDVHAPKFLSAVLGGSPVHGRRQQGGQ